MEHLLVLRKQLEIMEENINLFYGQKVMKPMLNRMLRNRHIMIRKITRYQLRYFNRD